MAGPRLNSRKPQPNKDNKAASRSKKKPSIKTKIKKLIDKIGKQSFKTDYKNSMVRYIKKDNCFIVIKLQGKSPTSSINRFNKLLGDNFLNYSVNFKGSVNPKTNKQFIELKLNIADLNKPHKALASDSLVSIISKYISEVHREQNYKE